MSTLRLPVKGPKSDAPGVVILADNFGFMDNGILRMWRAGDAVRKPEEIAILLARKAPLEDLS